LGEAGFAEVDTSVGVFSPIDTPITAALARRTHLLDDRRVLDLLGRLGGWYILGSGRRQE
jgi:hypothetical protein